MKSNCDCYHTQRKLIYGYYPLDVGICWGTKEMEECNCGGNRTKCDFYPKVREKERGKNQEDGLIVTYDVCASDTPTLCVGRKDGNQVKIINTIQGDQAVGAYHLLTGGADLIQKHGYWYTLTECANAGTYCSVCNKKVYKEHYANVKEKSRFCPNCGAIMDGEFVRL